MDPHNESEQSSRGHRNQLGEQYLVVAVPHLGWGERPLVVAIPEIGEEDREGKDVEKDH